jgi:hypothetical protein
MPSRVPGTLDASGTVMRPREPLPRDDLILAILLLVIGLPRAILGLAYDRPIGVEGTLSLACVVLALLILAWRHVRAP